MGKLVAIFILLLLGYQQQDLLQRHLSNLLNLKPKLQTSLQMESYGPQLRLYITEQKMEGLPVRMPEPVSDWLNQNFMIKSGRPASQDYFGEFYRGINEPARLVSCGPNRECGDADDLTVYIESGQH